MSIAANKTTVRRYFEEALDKRNLDVLDEIVTTDCIIHRPEASEPIRGREAFKHVLERILQTYSEFTTRPEENRIDHPQPRIERLWRKHHDSSYSARLKRGGHDDREIA